MYTTKELIELLKSGKSLESLNAEADSINEQILGDKKMKEVPHTLARIALTSINDTGGFSLNANLVPPISGYMVSRKGMELKTNPAVGNIEAYLSRYWNMVNESSLFFGGWIDETDGTLYLDVSENVQDKDVAMRLAFARGQLAIYDVENGESIYLPERK